jgi:aspartate/methionine/tyrosine aminotransferase
MVADLVVVSNTTGIANINEVMDSSRSTTQDFFKRVHELLERGHVAATPGIGFCANGEGIVWFSHTADVATIAEAMDRVEKFLEARKQ